MWEVCKHITINWNSEKNQRTKLQQAYVLIIILLAVAAGFLSLLNVDFGRVLMLIATFIAIIYVVNGVAWALLDAFVSPVLPKATPDTKRTTRKKK